MIHLVITNILDVIKNLIQDITMIRLMLNQVTAEDPISKRLLFIICLFYLFYLFQNI